MKGRVLVVASALIGGLTACGVSEADLPDRDDPGVVATERRLAAIIGADDRIVGGDAHCEVRLLRDDPPVAYAWAECFGVGAVSLPVRVEGDAVEFPGDGGQYGEDVERLFPSDLVELILQPSTAVRPSPPVTTVPG